MTTFTPNFNLDLYEGTDKPDLTDQYNAAMAKLDDALEAAQAARVVMQNSLTTLNRNLQSTNEEVENLSGEVGKLEPISAQHVEFFNALGVTDEQSAGDLHTQIDNAYQGVMSLTPTVAELSNNFISPEFDISPVVSPDAETLTSAFVVAVNKSKNVFKVWGNITNTTAETVRVSLSPVEGGTGYGLKLDYDTGLRPVKARYFDCCAITSNPKNAGITQYVPLMALGTDGRVYVNYSQTSDTLNFYSFEKSSYLQIPIYLSTADWPQFDPSVNGRMAVNDTYAPLVSTEI